MRGRICSEVDHRILVLNYVLRRGYKEEEKEEVKKEDG